MCVCNWAAIVHFSVFDSMIKTVCLYDFIKIL